MLLRNLYLLTENPVGFFILFLSVATALTIAITVHEFSHAFMAYRLGDNTAQRMGRLSLNPLVHLDPIGTALLFLVGFGWGKPVPVNPYFLKGGMKSGVAKVALAGPVAGLITAIIFSLFIRFSGLPLYPLFFYIILFNLILSFFNLIPLPPLDGFRILANILPAHLSYPLYRLETYGPLLLIFLILFDSITGVGLLWHWIRGMVNLVSLIFLGEKLM